MPPQKRKSFGGESNSSRGSKRQVKKVDIPCLDGLKQWFLG